MRFIGAMINALGSLIPLGGPQSGSPASEGSGPGPDGAGATEGGDPGSFGATLLQLLGQKPPTQVGRTGPPLTFNGTENSEGQEAEGQQAPSRGLEGNLPEGPRTEGPHTEVKPGAAPGHVAPSLAEGFPPSTGSTQVPTAGEVPKPAEAPTGKVPAAKPEAQGMSAPLGPAPSKPAAEADTGPSGASAKTPQAEAQGPERVQPQPAMEVLAPDRAVGSSEPMEASELKDVRAPAESFPVDTDPEKLEPEFRERLDRVISRMKQEHGHRVDLVEGYRSAQRQQALFAQGRTQPGDVVTWTTNSLHSQGRAADLKIDGSWNNPTGYARLQQIAKEEGLNVLGSKDPGHVELPAEGDPRANSQRLNRWGSRGPSGAVSRPAQVAQVARTARVATPAPVGHSSRFGSPASPPSPSVPRPEAQAPQQTSSIPAAPETPRITVPTLQAEVPESGPVRVIEKAGGRPGGSLPGTGSVSQDGAATVNGLVREHARRDSSDAGKPGNSKDRGSTRIEADARPTRPHAEPALAPDGARSPSPRGAGQVDSVQRATTADRVQDILSLNRTWDTQALGRTHLDLENADGAGTRVRLALRGAELAGTIDLADPVLAGRMRQRIGELHEALSRQGLEAKGIEARAISGIEGKGGADGDMAALLKDPLTGLARLMEARDTSQSGRSHDHRSGRDEAQRDFERFRESPRQDRNKEDRK